MIKLNPLHFLTLLFCFSLFICVFALSNDNCPKLNFFFDVQPQKCYFSTPEKEIFTKLKIVQTNTHDFVLKHWLENYEHLKGKKYTLLHVDSHPDIDIITKMNKYDILNWKFDLLHEKYGITIANFISPMLFLGLIERVIWLTPDYEYSYDKFKIGHKSGTNKVRTNSSSTYIGDGERLKKTESFGKETHDVEFITMKIGDLKKLKFKLNPSETLLDIDYDYFSTNSPLLDGLIKYFKTKDEAKEAVSIFNESNYCIKNNEHLNDFYQQQLKAYKKSPFQNSREGASEFWMVRILQQHLFRCFIGEKKSWRNFIICSTISRKLWCKGIKDATRIQLIFKDYMDHMKEEEEEDTQEDVEDLLQEAHSVASLPETNRSLTQIRKNAKILKKFFSDIGLNSPPAFVSLAQSIHCGHTPKHLVEFIKYEIYTILHDLFLNKN
eukprot:gene4551-7935_t